MGPLALYILILVATVHGPSGTMATPVAVDISVTPGLTEAQCTAAGKAFATLADGETTIHRWECASSERPAAG